MRGANRLLKILLGTLCVAIVALCVGIIVMNRPNQESVGQNGTYPATIHTEELSEINAQAADASVEEASALYEEVIAGAPTELDLAQTQVEYGEYLIEHDLDEEGLGVLLSINDEILGANYKMLLYAALRDYYSSVDNDELASKYNDMIGEAIRNSDYAAGD